MTRDVPAAQGNKNVELVTVTDSRGHYGRESKIVQVRDVAGRRYLGTPPSAGVSLLPQGMEHEPGEQPGYALLL
jgi:hypothetical protein